jgi:hypothetical protein
MSSNEVQSNEIAADHSTSDLTDPVNSWVDGMGRTMLGFSVIQR